MRLYEKEFEVPIYSGKSSLLSYFRDEINSRAESRSLPIRFVVTETSIPRRVERRGRSTG
jgi:hypothetical protein